MFRLYVQCPYCDFIFASGFQAESPIQLMGLSYLCQKCRRIFYCSPPSYLKKVDGSFRKAMKREEVFALPPEGGVLLAGPDLFELKGEVVLRAGRRLGSDRVFLVYRGKRID